MENEPRTSTDCEQGIHRWSRLYACASGTKAVCRECGLKAVVHGDEWELVPKK